MLPLKFLRLASVPAALFSFLLFADSCKKDQGPAPTNIDSSANMLNDNVILLDPFAVFSVDASSVTVNNSRLSKVPEVGSILAQSGSGNNMGLLRRVTEVYDLGNDHIQCYTEICGIGDAFKNLNVDLAYTEPFNSNFNARDGSSLSASFSHTTFAPGLEANGILKINVPTVKIEFQKKLGSNAPEKIVVLADINTEESELELIHTEDVQLDLEEFPLKQFDLPTIFVKIPVPTEKGLGELVVPFTQKVLLYVLPISVKGKVKLHLNPVIHATVGARYDASSDWQNLTIDAIDAVNQSTFCSSEFSTASGFSSVNIFSPVYEIAPYGSDPLKGRFQFINQLNLVVSNQSPNYSLDYMAGIQASFNLNFWDGTNRILGAGAEITTKNLATGDWSACRTAK